MTVRIWGSEQLVNLHTANVQFHPAIARLGNGDLLVVWQDNVDGTLAGADIRGRIYGPDGIAKSPELLLASAALQDENPSVTALANGGFQLAYERAGGILTPRFTANGTPDGTGPSIVATSGDTSLASLGDGNGFYMGYTLNSDPVLTRVDADGATPHPRTVSSADGIQGQTDVAVLADGRPVMAWLDNGAALSATIFSTNGTTISILLASPGPNTVSSPDVVALSNGNFAVTWTQTSSGGDADIHLRILMPNFGPVLGDTIVNGRTVGFQSAGDTVALPDGGFISVWSDVSSFSIRGQQFDNYGGRIGTEFQVSSLVASISGDRAITAAVMADGRVAVTWDTSSAALGSLGDGDTGVHLQIIDPRDGIIAGTLNPDVLYGSAYADQITGLLGPDTVFAGASNDVVFGGEGDDTLNGENGDDIIYGEDGNDTIQGGDGNDLVFGGIGNDTLRGGFGDDTLNGGKGDDMMFGGVGSDTFTGGLGHDTLQGGLGYADTFRFQAAADSTIASNDFITDFEHGSDKIDLSFIRVNGGTNVSISSSGGVTYVNVDLNADGSDDMHIQALGTNVLDITDIILPTVALGSAVEMANAPHTDGMNASHYLLA